MTPIVCWGVFVCSFVCVHTGTIHWTGFMFSGLLRFVDICLAATGVL